MRAVLTGAASVLLAQLLAGCASTKVGPTRSVELQEDVDYTKPLQRFDLNRFYALDQSQQAAMRNEIVTARMYAADVEFHYYEARLTRETQEEGLGATLSALGLTTASTLVGGVEAKTILSGAAAAVIGADKAYNEKELLSNSIQALQLQMRADRKTQAAVIYSKMFDAQTRRVTPIAVYTLPMALSDAEAYYQAGTVTSALIGLSRTLATADRNADRAKSDFGPNPGAVSAAQSIATPVAEPIVDPVILRAAHDHGADPVRLQPPPGIAVAPPKAVAAPPVHSPKPGPGPGPAAEKAKIDALVAQIEDNNRIIAAIKAKLASAPDVQERQGLNDQLADKEQANVELLKQVRSVAAHR